MSRVIVLTKQGFSQLAQELSGKRFVNEQLAGEGFENLALDAYGDWIAIPEQALFMAGTVYPMSGVLRTPVVV